MPAEVTAAMPAEVNTAVVVSVRRGRIAFSDGTGFSVSAPSAIVRDDDGGLWLTSRAARGGRRFQAYPFKVGSTKRLIERIVEALEAEHRYGPPFDVTEGVATFRDITTDRLIRIDTWGGTDGQ